MQKSLRIAESHRRGGVLFTVHILVHL